MKEFLAVPLNIQMKIILRYLKANVQMLSVQNKPHTAILSEPNEENGAHTLLIVSFADGYVQLRKLISAYVADLIGPDPFIHQDLTMTTCYYKDYACIPQEIHTSVIIWNKVNHTTTRFRFLGNYTIHRLDDFVLVPQLNIGGAVQTTSTDEGMIQLHNGYLVEKRHSQLSRYARFLNISTRFLKLAKPSPHTDLLDAHIAVALEMQRSTMIRSWEQVCHQQGEMDRIKTQMISRFPESSAPWVTQNAVTSPSSRGWALNQ